MPAASPLDNADGPVRIVLSSGGAVLPDATAAISITVRRAVNKVPSATLVFDDGDMPSQSFPLSDSAHLKPGAEITIKAGYGDGESALFSGIVVKHGLRISGDNAAQLVVECRDKAVRMTLARQNKQFVDKTDSDILSDIIGQHGLAKDVVATTVTHAELIQHYCTDWDFLLARAEANGCLVSVLDGKVTVAEPKASGDAELVVRYGESLIEFDAELDARHQVSQVQARSWDAKSQELLEGAATQPATLSAHGNLDAKALAGLLGVNQIALQTGAALAKPALQGWAKAQQVKAGLSRLRGRMRFQGSARPVVGGLIDLTGVGDRFSGKVFATGLTHTIEDGAWSTEVEFGTPAAWFTEQPDVMAPAAAGWVPGIHGLHVGVVLKVDADPTGEHRIQIKLPAAGVDSVWARLAQFHASNGFGAFFIPEVGDELVVGFLDDDPACPLVLGSLYSSKRKPPLTVDAKNHLKSIVTRCKARIEFNDEDKVITVETPAQNSIVLSDKDKSITLTDQNGNSVKLSSSGIALDSPKDITISAKGAITVSAVGALKLESKADVKVGGLNVECAAQVGLTAKGSATAELSAAGQTTVKGAMVMIN